MLKQNASARNLTPALPASLWPSGKTAGGLGAGLAVRLHLATDVA